MCFVINSTVKPWRNRFVYKIVQGPKDRESWGSPMHGNTRYALGRTTTAKGSPHFVNIRGFDEAYAGIYVYRTRETATRRARGWGWNRVIKCAVDPKDFLFTDGDTMATYKKVKPVELVK